MHTIFGRQLRHSAAALIGFSATRFEPRFMVPAFLHILICLLLEASRRQIIAYATVRFSCGEPNFINHASPEAMYRVPGMTAHEIEAKALEVLGVATVGKRA
jgi:hypothetical protein